MRNEGVLKKWFGLCENAWFLWQHIANSKKGSAYKITHISAVTYPRLLNLKPNESLDKGLFYPFVAYANLIAYK